MSGVHNVPMADKNPFRILGQYNGYADFKERGFENATHAIGDFANEVADKYRETGELPQKLDDLKASLFFEFRRAHHFGEFDPEDEYLWALNEAIQKFEINRAASAETELSAERIMDETIKSIRYLDEKTMAFLFATGKVELIVRNLLAKSLTEKLDLGRNQRIIPEWKRHDLAIVDLETPQLILEGKAWLHADAVHLSKLDKGQAEIKNAFEKDLEKIRNTRQDLQGVRGFISTIFSSIDVTNCPTRVSDLISYPELHKAGIKSQGSFEELHGMGRSLFTEFLQNRPEVYDIKRGILFVGNYEGMEIWVDIFVVEV